MQPEYDISKPRGRSDSSSKQGQGQLPDQNQNPVGFSNERSWRPLPPNGSVQGVGGDGSLRMPSSSQGASMGMPGPRGPIRTMGGFRQVPPPINVRPHTMSMSTDMYGGGMAFPPGMTPTGPSISWTDEDVWAGMNASQPDPRMGLSQDASMGGLVLSPHAPQMMPVPPLHPMSTLQSPTDNAMPINANVLAHRQAPSSAHSSNGMFGYSMGSNNDRMHAATPYFAPHQTFPEAGPSSDPPLVPMTDAMMHRYGHRQSTGSIGDQLAMSGQSQSLSLDDMGETRPNWFERNDARDHDDLLDMHDDELDEDDEDGEADGRPRKKPRNSLRRGTACVRCRSKKLKCTGERPVCSVCQNSRKPVECVYQPMAKRKPKTQRLRSRLQELEDQIKEKEMQLRRLDQPLSDAPLVTRSKLGIISEEPEAGFSQVVPSSDLFRSRESTQGSGLHVLSNVSNMLSTQGQTPATLSNATFEGFSLDTGEAIFETKRGVGAGSSRFASPLDSDSNRQHAGVDSIRGNLAMNRLSDSASLHAQGLVFGPGSVDVMPSSPIEYALIYAVLPYSLYFCMPVHPARFLESLLPASTQRPHPALLYGLFTASIYVLVNKLPPPPEAMPLPSRFPRPDNSLYLLLTDLESPFYSRAKAELDLGLQAGVQMDDVTKASAGLAKYLLLTGRVLQALMLPFVRLAMACGLHRISLPQDTTESGASQPSAGEGFSPHAGLSSPIQAAADARTENAGTGHYHYRPKLVIVPPAPDQVSLWERIETFWAIKELDWGTSLLWAWSCGLADNEIQTAWPQRFETFMSPEIGRRDSRGIWDLMNAKKPLSREASDPRVLALQSLSLVSTANRLFDLPTPLSTLTRPNDPKSNHPFTQYSLKKLQRALEAFRTSLPDSENLPETISSDPWWVFTRANVATADMLFYAESAVSQPAMYAHAVSAARRLVELMRGLPVEIYAHLNCFVFLDVSLVARFLYREATRLKLASTDPQSSQAALADADTLLRTLEEKAGKWHPFGLYLAEDIRRVKQGERERPELYERGL